MGHFLVTNKETGESQFVMTNRGKEPKDEGYPAETFNSTRRSRAAKDNDIVVDGVAKSCPITRKRLDRESQLAGMSRVEFFDYIMAEVEKRSAPLT